MKRARRGARPSAPAPDLGGHLAPRFLPQLVLGHQHGGHRAEAHLLVAAAAAAVAVIAAAEAERAAPRLAARRRESVEVQRGEAAPQGAGLRHARLVSFRPQQRPQPLGGRGGGAGGGRRRAVGAEGGGGGGVCVAEGRGKGSQGPAGWSKSVEALSRLGTSRPSRCQDGAEAACMSRVQGGVREHEQRPRLSQAPRARRP
jgi:hypothetical protein